MTPDRAIFKYNPFDLTYFYSYAQSEEQCNLFYMSPFSGNNRRQEKDKIMVILLLFSLLLLLLYIETTYTLPGA